MANTRQFNDEQWREQLTPDEFRICRQKGTEPPFSGAYCDEKAAGIYHCKCCHQALFDAAAKYDSGSGWPSFYQAMDENAIDECADTSHGMRRTEITCAHCGAHLGHLFDDGPEPTGLRYCVNSASLQLDPS
jgi:peptide-methionine (R)-S-oxide reductase